MDSPVLLRSLGLGGQETCRGWGSGSPAPMPTPTVLFIDWQSCLSVRQTDWPDPVMCSRQLVPWRESLWHTPIPHTMYIKINSSPIVDLHVKLKTMQILEENIERNFRDLGLVKDFSDTKNTIHKGKVDHLDFINIKNFCFSKDTIKRIKRQATTWNKMQRTKI